MRVAVIPGTGEKIFRVSGGVRWLSLAATALLGLMSIGFAVATALIWREGLGLTLEFAVLTALIGGLTRYVGRDLEGKWGLRFAFGPEAVTADLPRDARLSIGRLANTLSFLTARLPPSRRGSRPIAALAWR